MRSYSAMIIWTGTNGSSATSARVATKASRLDVAAQRLLHQARATKPKGCTEVTITITDHGDTKRQETAHIRRPGITATYCGMPPTPRDVTSIARTPDEDGCQACREQRIAEGARS